MLTGISADVDPGDLVYTSEVRTYVVDAISPPICLVVWSVGAALQRIQISLLLFIPHLYISGGSEAATI